MAATETTIDGSIIPGTISGSTAHTWVADANGTFQTTTDLGAEWKADYASMLAGHADTLTTLQRMEGNAEAVVENTGAAKLSATNVAAFRADTQREYDAIDAAMQMNQATLGISASAQFTTNTYLRMEQTLQGNEQLKELGYQGHGVNNSPAIRYDGFTIDFQNRTDNSTYYVGGGPGNGAKAIVSFFDDDVLTHAPFPTVSHNGQLQQLNQNGNIENPISDAVVAANNAAFIRVLTASDFSANPNATGEIRLVPGATLAVSNPMLGVSDGTTGQSSAPTMDATQPGGPSYLQYQYIYAGADSLAVSTATPNSFLHTGAGNDALQVTSGQNVLDGGSGSNFLTGGTGTDTFFTDARGIAPVWNTIRNFHAGDAATLWGYTPGVSTWSWDAAVGGAAGSEGATLRANIVGGAGRTGNGIDASITFTGLTIAQASHLQIVTGTQPAGSYLYIANPGV